MVIGQVNSDMVDLLKPCSRYSRNDNAGEGKKLKLFMLQALHNRILNYNNISIEDNWKKMMKCIQHRYDDQVTEKKKGGQLMIATFTPHPSNHVTNPLRKNVLHNLETRETPLVLTLSKMC